MHDPELEEVLRIGRRAAHAVREVYATPFTVEMKGPGDPVTRADREANAIICEALAASFPDDAILAEESVPDEPEEVARRVSASRVWYVDPLDGTRDFAARNGEFAVMIGLVASGRPALGVLVLPATGEAFLGRVGHGAFAEEEDGGRRPISVSSTREPARAGLLVSRSRAPSGIMRMADALGIRRVVPCGSVGVKVARIVLGHADLYVHGDLTATEHPGSGLGAKRWDTCAPEAVLVAAGGQFTDLDGAPIDYERADLAVDRGIVASNGALHAAALGAIAALRGLDGAARRS